MQNFVLQEPSTLEIRLDVVFLSFFARGALDALSLSLSHARTASLLQELGKPQIRTVQLLQPVLFRVLGFRVLGFGV